MGMIRKRLNVGDVVGQWQVIEDFEQLDMLEKNLYAEINLNWSTVSI